MKVSTISEISRIITETRISQNLLASELASLSGVSTSFLSDLENGKETLQIGKVLAVISQLGISIEATPPAPVNEAEESWPTGRKRARP